MNRFLPFFLLCSLTLSVFAEHVEKNEAADIAGVIIPNQQLNDVSNHTLFDNLYVFSDEHSFVIISADDSYRPIVAYSNESPFVFEDMPDNIRYWLGSMNREVQYAIDTKLDPSEDIKAEWSDLRRGVMPAPKDRTSVSPLLHVQWGQDEPYSNMCPETTDGEGHCPVGCAATAMAQIMKYWEWPRQGVGSHSYTATGYGTQTAYFGNTIYDWDNMPAKATTSSTAAQQNAVATLSYHCGVSLDMSYGDDGSGAVPSKVLTALKTYFNYSNGISSAYKSYYSLSQWIDLLKSEINAGRPIHYSGWDTNGGGHGFVCDGYDDSDNFHFNWGWNGSCDGYYAIGYLSPGQGGTGSGSGCYNENNYVIIGIQPNNAAINAPANLSASIDGKNVTLTWDAVANADHYKVYRDGSVIDADVSGTSFTDAGLPYGTFTFSVRSVKSDGDYSLASSITAEVTFAGPVPTNLTASASGSTVELLWNAPASENAVLKYGDGTPSGSALGYGSSIPFYWGQRYTREQLEPYAGMAIQSVQIYHSTVHQYTLHIYRVVDGSLAETVTQVYNTTTANSWFTVTLPAPEVIDYTNDIMIAVHCDDLEYPAKYVSYSSNANAGLYGGNGTGYYEYPGISWLIKTNITDGTYTYNIYCDGDEVASNVSETTYTDSGVESGQHTYYATTNYYGGESQPSNYAVVNVAGGETCDAPANLTASLDVNNVTVQWDAVDGIETYSLYRNGTLLDDEVDETYYEDALDAYGTYSYYVKSNCPDGSTSVKSNAAGVNYAASGPVVTNLTGTVNGDNVTLTWTEPEISSRTINYGTSLTSIASSDYWAQVYDASKLSECTGMAVEKVQFLTYNTGLQYTMRIYNGSTPTDANLLATKSFTSSSSWAWVNVVLDTPVYVDCSQNLWVTFYCTAESALTMGTYTGDDVANALLMSDDGVNYYVPSWTGGGTYSAAVKVCMTDYYTYNVYNDDVKIAENRTGASYSYTESNSGFHRYYLKTNYYAGESQPSSSVYVPAGVTKQYIGGSGGQWSVAGNWSGNALPTSSDKVWIKNDIVVNTYADVNSLYIDKGRTATVSTGNTLKVADDVESLSLSKWLTVESDAAFMSDAPGVRGTVKRQLTVGAKDDVNGKWHFLSSPVTSAPVADFIGNAGDDGCDLYLYDEPSRCWYNENADGHSADNEFYTTNGANFVPGCGYLTSYTTTATMSFNGVFNTGDVAVPVTASSSSSLRGFNLIGNPYPCSIDWNASSGWTRDVLSGSPYIWIYNDDVHQYGACMLGQKKGTNGVNNIIASCQGFFVKANEDGNIVIKNNAKKDTLVSFRDVNDSESISVKVTGKNGSDEVMICLTNEKFNNAEKLFSRDGTVPSMYLNVEGEKYSIVNVGEDETLAIPMGFECGTTGKFTISSNSNVELIDNLTGNVTDLSSNSYEFIGSVADNADRFLIRIPDSSGDGGFVYQSGDDLIVKGNGRVQVFDCLGRVVIDEYANGGSIDVSALKTGVYVVRVENRNQKIVIR